MTPRIGATYIDVTTGVRYTAARIADRRFVVLAPQGGTLADTTPGVVRVHDTHLHETDHQPNGLPLRRGYRLQTWEDQ